MSGINIQNLFLNSFIYSILKWKISYFQSLPKFQVSFYQLCESFNNSLRFFFLKNSKIIHWTLIFPADWKVLLYIRFGVPHLNIKRRNVSLSLHNSILGPHTYAQTTNWQKLYIPKLDKEERRSLPRSHDSLLLRVPENYLMSKHIHSIRCFTQWPETM